MTDLSTVLDEIEARADAATPGDWFQIPDMGVFGACAEPGCHQDPMAHPDVLRFEDDELLCPPSPEDLDFIAAARTDVPRLVAALRAVLDLHRPMPFGPDTVCWTCLANTSPMPARVPWPCSTVRHITSALTVEVGSRGE